jgi:hypothetical protein
MRLLWKQPLSDCHKLICERLGLEASEHHLHWRTPDGEGLLFIDSDSGSVSLALTDRLRYTRYHCTSQGFVPLGFIA